MVCRLLIRRGGLDDIGIAAGAGPQHHADRHWMRKFRFYLARDSDVARFV